MGKLAPAALSREDAAEYLALSTDLLDKLRAAGKIAAVKVTGAIEGRSAKRVRVIYPVRELDRYLERECQIITSSELETPPAGTYSGLKGVDPGALRRTLKTAARQRRT